ncbi:MAG: helix-turn-helix domain-containing protein [Candidatus Thermoplasmatota archaeon]|nr:helix-turn-helix domain-containing protein [Candidatus Thermoplasmatota archaeon]
MKPPCEIIVSKIIPIIRACIVNALGSEHKLKQTEIARRLGITQASVSQYFSSARATDKSILKLFPEVRAKASRIAKDVIEGKLEKSDIVFLVCSLCSELRKKSKFCKYHRSFAQLEKCRICYK